MKLRATILERGIFLAMPSQLKKKKRLIITAIPSTYIHYVPFYLWRILPHSHGLMAAL